VPEARIGQLLAEDLRPLAPQAALQDKVDRVLAAVAQRDVLGPNRAELAVGEPVHKRGAQGPVPAQARIFEIVLTDLSGQIAQDRPDRGALPHIGQLRAAQVDQAAAHLGGALDMQGLRRAELRASGRNEGPATDRRLEQPLLRRDLVGASDGPGRDPEIPGEVAHRRQPGALGQLARPHRRAQRVRQAQILRTFERRQIGSPDCTRHNVLMDREREQLY